MRKQTPTSEAEVESQAHVGPADPTHEERLARALTQARKKAGRWTEDDLLALPVRLTLGETVLKAKRLSWSECKELVEPILEGMDQEWLYLVVAEHPAEEAARITLRQMVDSGDQESLTLTVEGVTQAIMASAEGALWRSPETTINPTTEIVALAISPYEQNWDAKRLLKVVDADTLIGWLRDLLRAWRILPKQLSRAGGPTA